MYIVDSSSGNNNNAAVKYILNSNVSIHIIHGSLLVINELLQHTNNYYTHRFNELAELIYSYQYNTNILIQRTVISLMPKLAKLNTELFIELYLNQSIQYLIQSINNIHCRDVTFITLGELSLAINDAILPVLPIVIQHIRHSLTNDNLYAQYNQLNHNTNTNQKSNNKLLRNRVRSNNTVLQCIGMLCQALKTKLLPYTTQLIQSMFSIGLTAQLIDSLIDVCTNIPQLLPTVQEQLLHTIHDVLIDNIKQQNTQSNHIDTTNNNKSKQNTAAMKPINNFGSAIPIPVVRGNNTTNAIISSARKQSQFSHDGGNNTRQHNEFEHSILILALKTLSTFNFTGQSFYLIDLIHNTVIQYLSYELPIIRREAALTCCKLIPQLVEDIQLNDYHTNHIIYTVLHQLVTIAIADNIASIRLSVLSSFDSHIDKYLSQTELLSILFISLNDEVFAIREVSISLLGRLSIRNPAVVLPILRKHLIQLLIQLQQYELNNSIDIEESMRLLSHIIQSCPTLVRPYVSSILHILIPKLTKQSNISNINHTSISSYVLSTIGKLSLIVTDEMIVHGDSIIQLILQSLTNKTIHIKKHVAISVLGEVLSSIGYTLQPSPPIKYPTLISTLLSLLKQERNTSIRIEILKVIGIIGALDPIKYKSIIEYDNTINKHNSNDRPIGVIGAVYRFTESEQTELTELQHNINDENYLSTVTLTALIKCLDGGLGNVQLSNNLGLHGLVLKAIMFVIKSLNIQCIQFLPQIVPIFIQQIHVVDEPLKQLFIQQLGIIISIVKQNIRIYCAQLIELSIQYWSNQLLLSSILSLIEQIVLVLYDEFHVYINKIIPKLLNILHHDTSHEYTSTIRVLRCIRILSTKSILTQYLYVLIPALINLIQDDTSYDSIRRIDNNVTITQTIQFDAIHTIGRLAKYHDIADYASRIVQCFVRLFQLYHASNIQLYDQCINVLCILINQLGSNYFVFQSIIDDVLTIHNYNSVQYQRYTRLLAKLQHSIDNNIHMSQVKYISIHNAPTSNKTVNQLGELMVDKSIGHKHSVEGMTHHGSSMLSDNQYGSNIQQSQKHIATLAELIEISDTTVDTVTDVDSDSDTDVYNNTNNNDQLVNNNNALHDTVPRKLAVSQSSLMQSWSASQRTTKDDWLVWLRHFSIQLLRESPSSSLRACSALAQKYPPLAKELFNIAFLSCYSELYDSYQDDLIKSLDITFRAKNIPHDVMTTFLDLAEFMTLHDKTLPIDISVLAELAEQCQLHAKALHYRETEYMNNTTNTNTLESLISLNIKLQQHDAAHGILKLATSLNKHSNKQLSVITDIDLIHNNNNTSATQSSDISYQYSDINEIIELKESWYEKLERWEDALESYERKQLDIPDSIEIKIGRMRCLQALNEWDRLYMLSYDTYINTADNDLKQQISVLGASSAVALRQWEHISTYVQSMNEHTTDYTFYNTILSIHNNQYQQAYKHIEHACELLDSSLNGLMSESYTRVYPQIMKIQQFIELNEVIQYKLGDRNKQEIIRRTWQQRLSMCERSADVWQSILSIRSLVITAREDIETWLEFATLCRKSTPSRLHLSLKVLTSLLGVAPNIYIQQPSIQLPPYYPQLTLAVLKHLYTAGYQREAYQRLHELVNSPTALHYTQNRPDGLTSDQLAHLRSVGYLKLGSWQLWMLESHFDRQNDYYSEQSKLQRNQQYAHILPNVITCFNAACQADNQYYKAWHQFAMVNFRVVSQYKNNDDNTNNNNQTSHSSIQVENYVIPAVRGFFRSIWLHSTYKSNNTNDNLSTTTTTSVVNTTNQSTNQHDTMQDVLRVLALWYDWGMRKDVDSAVLEGIDTIKIDTWLDVIPQLIARIYTPHKQIRMLLVELLCRIGKAHPQALVWPLTVASKSPSEGRRRAAVIVLQEIRKYSSEHAQLVVQSLMVSAELVRVAILWHELFHEGIEEASRQWFGNKSFDGMWKVLQPLHIMLNKGATTQRELSFEHEFSKDINDAYDIVQRYIHTHDTKYITRAWEIYSSVFRRLSKIVSSVSELELQDVSPKLLTARDLLLYIPGSYQSNHSNVSISYFAPLLRVIESKQHPRRLLIGGSDGYEYAFLLKGHEDLRQDERCMQLFGLINNLLSNQITNNIMNHNELSIERYAVIPLSVWPQSGLIAWIPYCDPIHAIIKQYRDMKKILLNIEQRLMQRYAPDYQLLTIIQKVEVFEYALDMTTGYDLAKMLYLRSSTADIWLDRRVNFTRSLAVMSMVGYILGLGDRHTCNLLLDRKLGKLIHIDFGDCFEVAMYRDKYPERVPFRLTRMLVNTMEIAGIDGTFRATCETVMSLLRKNKNSVMAVLEAFVHDPLINWRLLPHKDNNNKQQQNNTNNASSTANPSDATTAQQQKQHEQIADIQQSEQKDISTSPAQSTNNNNQAAVAAELPVLDLHRQRSTTTIILNNTIQPSVDFEIPVPTEKLNERAVTVIGRVESKLKGTDFMKTLDHTNNNDNNSTNNKSSGKRSSATQSQSSDLYQLDVSQQVSRLITEATAHTNLCQAYIGWCPFW